MAAKENNYASAPPAVLLQTRVRGLAPENTNAIGLQSPLSSTVRWGSWQAYDGTASDRLVGLDYFGARYFSAAQGRFTSPDPSNLGVDFWLPQTWNRYTYVINRPMSMVDRNGLWPFYIHESIIDQAFPGMSKTDLEFVKSASWNMDYASGKQETDLSPQHEMSDGGGTTFWGGGNAAHAEIDANKFIDEQVAEAQRAQAEWQAQGHPGFSPAALTAFGNALHTVTDGTSPPHVGYQPWAKKPWWHWSTIKHVARESWATPGEMKSARTAAWGLFQRTFGLDYLRLLRPVTACVTTTDSATGKSTRTCE